MSPVPTMMALVVLAARLPMWPAESAAAKYRSNSVAGSSWGNTRKRSAEVAGAGMGISNLPLARAKRSEMGALAET